MLKKQAEIYGIAIYGDGATINTDPLTNIMASGVFERQALLDVVDCTGHMAEGNMFSLFYFSIIGTNKSMILFFNFILIRRKHISLGYFGMSSPNSLQELVVMQRSSFGLMQAKPIVWLMSGICTIQCTAPRYWEKLLAW